MLAEGRGIKEGDNCNAEIFTVLLYSLLIASTASASPDRAIGPDPFMQSDFIFIQTRMSYMANGKSKEHGKYHTDGVATGNNTARLGFKWGGLIVIFITTLVVIAIFQSRSGRVDSDSTSIERRITATDFSLTLYQGADLLGDEELKFSDLFSRQKPVVLNFWAGLCPPCRAEMPFFQNVYDELGDQFILLGLDIGPFIGLGSNEDARILLQELNITYPSGTTFDANIVAAYNIRAMPTTVFLTPDGTIFEVHTGTLDEESLRAKVEKLFQASESP